MADLFAPVRGLLGGWGALADVERALAQGADPNRWEGPTSPIRFAVQSHHVELLGLLLRRGADANQKDSRGVAALHQAVFDGKGDCITELLDAGADIDVLDCHQQTPLFFAPSRQICELLLARRADVTVVNCKRQSPLHLAAYAGLSDAVGCLVEAEKDLLQSQDLHGHTPLCYAAHAERTAERKLRATTSFLQKRGGKRGRSCARSAPPPPRPQLAREAQAAAPAAGAEAAALGPAASKAERAQGGGAEAEQVAEEADQFRAARQKCSAALAAGSPPCGLAPPRARREAGERAIVPGTLEREREEQCQGALEAALGREADVVSAARLECGAAAAAGFLHEELHEAGRQCRGALEAALGREADLVSAARQACGAAAAAAFAQEPVVGRAHPGLECAAAPPGLGQQQWPQAAPRQQAAAESLSSPRQQAAPQDRDDYGSRTADEATGHEPVSPAEVAAMAARGARAGGGPGARVEGLAAGGEMQRASGSGASMRVAGGSRLAARGGETSCLGGGGQQDGVHMAEKDGCLQWKVFLKKEAVEDKFGFVQANGRLVFESRMTSVLQRSPQNAEYPSKRPPTSVMECLIVRKVHDHGLLRIWNLRHSRAAVKLQDRITSVNGEVTVEGMQREIRSRQVLMNIMRCPDVFEVTLSKEGGKKLGFRFEKPQNPTAVGLRITEVLAEGALPDHNTGQLILGGCHHAVLPDMRIESANGISGDSVQIAAELKRADAVRLVIRRAEQEAAIRQHMRQCMSELSARAGAGSPTRCASGASQSG